MLVVLERDDANTCKSLRNIADVVLLSFDQLNTYDVLKSDDVVFTKAAFDAFVAARSAEGAKTVALSAATEVDAATPSRPQKAAKKARPRRLRTRLPTRTSRRRPGQEGLQGADEAAKKATAKSRRHADGPAKKAAAKKAAAQEGSCQEDSCEEG